MARESPALASPPPPRKDEMPSASRIEGLPGSRLFACPSPPVACAASPSFKWRRPCWKRSYVSLTRAPRRRRLTRGVSRPQPQRAERDEPAHALDAREAGADQTQERAQL